MRNATEGSPDKPSSPSGRTRQGVGRIPADNPIRSEEEDRLGRAAVAKVLAGEIRTLDASEGCVVGILGPWGSGKTSLIELIRRELEAEPPLTVLEFNPWLFSGADQLLESFFLDVGAQFRGRTDKLGELAGDLEAYGEVVAPLKWLPVVGVWVERARSVTRALKKIHERRKDGALAQRNRLAAKLRDLDSPIVVVIDDIDRLRTAEIREIFKLVRLTANFPKVIYLLAFDRKRVEIALTEEGLVGRDYLEKILQVAQDIPVMPDSLVTTLLTESIDESLKDVENPGPFSSDAWSDVLFEIVRPLVRNMRDIRRYVAALHGTVLGLEGRVQLVDVLGLEAIRVFLPDVFASMSQAVEGLTTPASMSMYHQDHPQLKASIEAMIAAAPGQEDLVRAGVRRLFPAGQRHTENNNYGPEWQKVWLRERRVAHPDVLRYYLERLVGEQLAAFAKAEDAFSKLGDEASLKELLEGLEGDALAETIQALEVYEGEFPKAAIEPASAVLLNQIHRLPERIGGMFGVDADIIVDRVVLRMLRQLESPEETEDTVRRILPRVNQLSDKLDLITLVGYREGAGHKLVSEASAKDFEAELRGQVRKASSKTLATERDLLRLLYWTKKGAEEADEKTPTMRRSVPLYAALLKASVSAVWSASMGSRSTKKTNRLHWDTLVEIAGGETSVEKMVKATAGAAAEDEGLAQARDLAEKYLSGWRPQD